jgi:hypothetical protein
LVLFGARAVPARAATTVDCSTNSGALAAALATASDGDTLTIQGTCVGTFEIAHSLMLQGTAGATLDGANAGTVLMIDSGEAVDVSGLTVTGGNPSGVDPIGGGIEIDAGATVTITNATVSDNTPRGIANVGGDVTVSRTLITGNTGASFGIGGGIFTSGSFSPENTTPGTLTLEDSTVSNNTAVDGGGIESEINGTLTVLNSTITGNTAVGSAGGIDFFGSTNDIEFSTISGNSALFLGGGGISGGEGSISLTGTIVAGQLDGGNCAGLITDSGYNLDDDGSCGFTPANNSLSDTNPMLDPAGLANNGGPTQTIALEPGRVAIDAIPSGAIGCGTTDTTDQRGVTRPQGAGCDIGAFEAEQSPAALLAALGTAVIGVGPGTSLADKVNQAITYLNKNDIADTCSTLNAFINQVKAQTGKSIPAPEAATLIADARQIKTLLGC